MEVDTERVLVKNILGKCFTTDLNIMCQEIFLSPCISRLLNFLVYFAILKFGGSKLPYFIIFATGGKKYICLIGNDLFYLISCSAS